MSDVVAGPPGGSGPRWVLVAALGVAVLVAVTLIGFLLGSGGGEDDPAAPAAQAAAAEPGEAPRVRLDLAFAGEGGGEVRIVPGPVTCSKSCAHTFATGARVTATATADDGSTFDGWSDACDGIDDCSFVIRGKRSLGVTFEQSPAAARCADPIVAAETPACSDDEAAAPIDRSGPKPDCSDRRDNDGDGLIDSAQDPGCDTGGTEADPGDVPIVTTPVPTATGTTTAPAPAPTSTTPALPECRDGKDNDDDGLIDVEQDPGCESDSSESG